YKAKLILFFNYIKCLFSNIWFKNDLACLISINVKTLTFQCIVHLFPSSSLWGEIFLFWSDWRELFEYNVKRIGLAPGAKSIILKSFTLLILTPGKESSNFNKSHS